MCSGVNEVQTKIANNEIYFVNIATKSKNKTANKNKRAFTIRNVNKFSRRETTFASSQQKG